MKPGGIGYYVVGNNSTVVDGQKIVIPTDMFLNSLGKKAGWKPQSMISMELLLSRDIFKDNSGSTETILCFKA
jgi:site-specific DNA-methyltransferase (cytosine-N4-specific)